MSDKQVYVWEVPVRLTHWINVICLIALSVTGFYVGNPFIYAQSSEQYIMGWMRFIHFVAAYTFLMSIIIRLYWSVMGNKYACICSWLPFSGKKIAEIIDELKVYFLYKKRAKPHTGHSALAGLTYILVLCMVGFEVISGFALYSVTHSGMIWTILGGWLIDVMYLQTIRLWHHMFMYGIIVFTLLHIYSAVLASSQDDSGVLKSIFTGNKNIPEEDTQ